MKKKKKIYHHHSYSHYFNYPNSYWNIQRISVCKSFIFWYKLKLNSYSCAIIIIKSFDNWILS